MCSARATSATTPNANKPIGTGPFKFVEWQRGEFMRLDRNPDYWRKGQPYLDRIVVRFIDDAARARPRSRRARSHVGGFGAIPYIDVKRLAALPQIGSRPRATRCNRPIVELDMNTQEASPSTTSRSARRSPMRSTASSSSTTSGSASASRRPARSAPTSSALGLYTADVHNYNVPNGVEMANKLLDEAGLPEKADGIRFEIVHDITPYGEEWQRFGEYVQQQLAKVGIKVDAALRGRGRPGSSASTPTTTSPDLN